MRRLPALAAAAVLGPLLAWGVGAVAGDPLCGTVWLLPLVAVALLEIEGWGIAHGGRPTPRPRLAAEAAASPPGSSWCACAACSGCPRATACCSSRSR